MINISGCNIALKKTVSATLRSIYGVGRVKASKITEVLLTHPRAKKFKEDLVKLSIDPMVQKLFKSFESDSKLKIRIFGNLEKKAVIRCYKGIRILQNLPSRGQRTHTNAGTPKRVNPFLKLGVNESYSHELIVSNKRWELTWNNRSQADFDVNRAKRKFNKGAKDAKAASKKLKNERGKNNKGGKKS